MTTTDSLIADLEAGLAAAKALGLGEVDAPSASKPEPGEAVVDTSMMPGGADSAPVSAALSEPAIEPGVLSEAEAAAKPVLADVEHVAETEGLDLVDKLKDGKTVKEVAGLLHNVESNTAVESIVKAISDIAQGVRI